MAINKSSNKTIYLSDEEYSKLLEIYKKLGEILVSKKAKKAKTSLKSLYGIWKGTKVDEKDFKEVKKSLFKSSSL